MFIQIAIGSFLIVCTILVEVSFIELAIMATRRFGKNLMDSKRFSHFVLVLTVTALWLLAALSLAMWVWALGFLYVGAFDTLEAALYFAMASFTTLGFGDLLLPLEWRLLSGFAAANGLVLFGLNTAFLIEIMMRMRTSRR
ncbi:ion channel [Kordiimonas pumila]|uniref:Ion channel n=1 Tax=Kordiimonas pumila TaxID=2161677 RepID=A0ABV7D3Y1_9PROT|nr:ion channel [Kordiimonas pumila]